MPAVESACEQLASGPIPQTLMHGDLHGGNIALNDDGYVIFDWTDACISHPFFDLLTIVDNGYVPLEAAYREQLISAYLGEWTARGYGSAEVLRATCDLALKLGPLYHAISYWQIMTACEPPMIAEIDSALPYYLKCRWSGWDNEGDRIMPLSSLQWAQPHNRRSCFVAPTAVLIGDVTLHEGASVWFGCVLRGDVSPIVMGARSNIQDNTVIHGEDDSPLSLGEDVTVGHSAIIHAATVADRVLVGMGAVLLSRCRIGSDTIIGARASSQKRWK